MSRTIRLSLWTALPLLIGSHRLPAPISEITESPTPAPEQSATPKSKRTIKPKVSSESSESSTRRQTPLPPPKAQATAKPERFAGSWNGTLNRGLLGDVNYTLVVNAAGTSVKEICNSCSAGASDRPARGDGYTVTWRGGGLNDVACTLTPDNEGKTARVTMKGFFAIGDSVFRRTSP